MTRFLWARVLAVSAIGGALGAILGIVATTWFNWAQAAREAVELNMLELQRSHATILSRMEIAATLGPVGRTVLARRVGTVPPGWIVCDGQTIEVEDYPNVCRELQRTQLVLPSLRGVVTEADASVLKLRASGGLPAEQVVLLLRVD